MNNNTNCDNQGGNELKHGKPAIGDCVNYRSADGAVEIVTKVTTARRYPPHNYPIVCIKLRPKSGTRIQKLGDADGVEICLSHIETIQHLMALNAADMKSKYTWQEVPEKPADRKAYWDKVNRERRQKFNDGKK